MKYRLAAIGLIACLGCSAGRADGGVGGSETKAAPGGGLGPGGQGPVETPAPTMDPIDSPGDDPMGIPGDTARVKGNPFAGAAMYVNPDYAVNIQRSLANVPGGSSDAQLLQKVAQLPTAVWFDSINALAGGDKNNGRASLLGHLDNAVKQSIAAKMPVIVVFVIYNLPNRDCSAAASAGLLQGPAGLATYKAEYIDVVEAALKAKPEYAKLRIAMILEPDSLANMVTNTNLPRCAETAAQKIYEEGVIYAVTKLGALPNTYFYLDIAHSGWLGWPNNLTKAVAFYTQVVKQIKNGDLTAVRGFCTNVSNYTPLREPFVKPTDIATLNSPFYQANPVFDEATFVANLAAEFKKAGFTDMGFLIDTSRNGWKQVDDGKPIDRRKARGNWCNVAGTGLGERPQAAPAGVADVDAFVYAKPPGESDGISMPGDPRFDASCDAANPAADALPNAPQAGEWFEAQLLQLLRNATPAL